MSRRPWADRRILLTAAAVLVAGLGLFWILRPAPDEGVEVVEAAPEDAEAPEARQFEIYFPAADGRLHAEQRELHFGADPAENASRLVEALIAGPSGERRWPPLPEGVTLERAYLMGDATMVLDLAFPDGRQPDTGSRAETLMLYSLVNTVLLNVDEAERLVVLWNGQQPSTFAGHLDTTRPLTPNPELIAPGSLAREGARPSDTTGSDAAGSETASSDT